MEVVACCCQECESCRCDAKRQSGMLDLLDSARFS